MSFNVIRWIRRCRSKAHYEKISKLQFKKSVNDDIMYNVGNRVNNIVVTLFGARIVLVIPSYAI